MILAHSCALSAQNSPAKSTRSPTPATPAVAEPKPIDHSYKPLILKLNDDGSKFVRFLLWNQTWVSFNSNNAGTLDLNGNLLESSTSIGIRRQRFVAYGQVSPRFFLLADMGMESQTFDGGGAAGVTGANGGRRAPFYTHNAYGQYAVEPGKLDIGAGLIYWNGVSRMTGQGTTNMLTLDHPIFNWPVVDVYDQFASQLGVYAKGQLGRLDYRVAVTQPFAAVGGATFKDGVGFKSGVTAKTQAFDLAQPILTETMAFQGYLQWFFLEKEANVLPYEAGTVLGAKKVFNIGVGFYNHADAMGYVSSEKNGIGGYVDSIGKKSDIKILSADVYVDIPTKNKGAFSAYAAFYSSDFGKNYVRNVGVMNINPSSSILAGNTKAASWAGGGNAQPTIGTGTIFYTHVGYAFPKMSNGHQLMPYLSFTSKNFDYIGASSTQGAIGLNWFINGHNAKVTFEYATRPTYKVSETSSTVIPTLESTGTKGEFKIQTQVFL